MVASVGRMYRHIGHTWRRIWSDPRLRRRYSSLRASWRRGRTVQRIVKPSRLDKARMLGYKAKKGFVVVRVKVSRGGLRKIPPKLGRRQKRMGISKIKRGKSMGKIAEERALRKHPNLDLLGAYYVGEDGSVKWFEVVMKDPILGPSL